AIRQRSPALLGAAAWILTGLVLAYAPFAIQRRFLHGVTIPLALLSTQGLISITQYLSKKSVALAQRATSLAIVAVFLISFSNIYLSLGRSLYLLNQPDEFYYPASLNPALIWLDENAAPNEFVLSALPSGQLITQKTDLRVYLGHSMETLDYDTKSSLVDTYFQGQADPNWLETTKVQWVFYGPYERALAGEAIIDDSGLQVAYQSTEVTIYRVAR
ncbi:MAG: hypothetical protein AB8I58_11925, partial [Anaerolineales bacterium]